jgi:hypothetical protein
VNAEAEEPAQNEDIQDFVRAIVNFKVRKLVKPL